MAITVEADVLVAQLALDYLAWEESEAALGAEAWALEKHLMDPGVEVETPALVMVAMEDRQASSDARRVVRLTPILKTRLAIPEGAPAGSGMTSRTDASELLRAIDQRLADMDAFEEFLATLDDDRLCGWTFLDTPRRSGDAVIRGKDGDITYGLTWEWKIVMI